MPPGPRPGASSASSASNPSSDPRAALATANSLSYALGRRHIKSWMTSTPALPRPAQKRRPPDHATLDTPPDATLNTTSARTHNAPSVERLPASNSTSPQLANITNVAPDHAPHAQPSSAALPSPTPSDDDANLGDVTTVSVLPLQSPSEQLPPSPHPAPADTRLSRHQLPGHTQLPPDLPPLPEFLQWPPTSLPHGTSTADQQPSPASDPALPPNHPPLHPQPIPPFSHQNQPHHSQSFAIPPNPQQATHPRPVLSQHPPSQPNDWYTVDLCMNKLNVFKSHRMPQSNRETQRLRVLEEAITRQDWAYLTLHQQYCVMTCKPHALPTDVRRNPNSTSAYALMQEVLEDNTLLKEPLLAFFCSFPYTSGGLRAKWPIRQHELERGFVAFVNRSPVTAVIKQQWELRGVPPTPRELAACAIPSPSFQLLLFMSVFRSLYRSIPHHPTQLSLETQVSHVFLQAQAAFELYISQGQLGGSQQVDHEMRVWAQNIHHVTQSCGAQLRRSSLQPTGPTSPLSPHQPYLPQQQHSQHQQQHNQQQHHQQHHHQQHHHQQHHHQQQQKVQPHSQMQTYILPHNPNASSSMAGSHHYQQRPPQVMPPRTASQLQPAPRPPQCSTSLLPPSGVLLPQQRVPIPSRFALHQAHLQSPLLQALDYSSPYHYFWQGFAFKPSRLRNANNATEQLTFTLAKPELELIAKALPNNAPGAADRRAIDKDLKTIRLRCVKWPLQEEPKESAWAVADNSWIPHSYFTFNKTSLQLRKKLHHGKDLPVDLTGLVREGPNVLQVSIMSSAADTTHRNYLLAVEYLGVMTQADIKALCCKSKIPAEKTIEEFKRRLSPAITDDDDLVVVESTLTIKLRDPISASKMCDTPVRSTACLHNECFDLDTFLATRTRKGDVSVADQWRCPICGLDARPTVLVVDEFLQQVRARLESKRLLDTEAIIVTADGSWKPKPAKRDPNCVRDSDSDSPRPQQDAPRLSFTAVHEIINLDSD